MPPCRNATGFTGVRQRSTGAYSAGAQRSTGAYSAELRAGGERFNLGTFDTADRAAHARDAAAWRVGRPRRSMNFPDVESVQEAELMAPTPALITNENRRRHQQQQRRLDIAAFNEHAMAEWRRLFPQDVQAEEEFYAARRAQRDEQKKARRAARAERRLRKKEAEEMVEAEIDIDEESEIFAELWDKVSSDTTSLGSDWDDSDDE